MRAIAKIYPGEFIGDPEDHVSGMPGIEAEFSVDADVRTLAGSAIWDKFRSWMEEAAASIVVTDKKQPEYYTDLLHSSLNDFVSNRAFEIYGPATGGPAIFTLYKVSRERREHRTRHRVRVLVREEYA